MVAVARLTVAAQKTGEIQLCFDLLVVEQQHVLDAGFPDFRPDQQAVIDVFQRLLFDVEKVARSRSASLCGGTPNQRAMSLIWNLRDSRNWLSLLLIPISWYSMPCSSTIVFAVIRAALRALDRFAKRARGGVGKLSGEADPSASRLGVIGKEPGAVALRRQAKADRLAGAFDYRDPVIPFALMLRRCHTWPRCSTRSVPSASVTR